MSADRSTMLARAARMRREPTEAERRLRRHLRASQLGGHKVRRQATIGARIVDLFCPAKGLISEIDGGTHEPARDARRDARRAAASGLAVLRFSNGDVKSNMEGVLMCLSASLSERPDRWVRRATSGPSSEEAEEGRSA